MRNVDYGERLKRAFTTCNAFHISTSFEDWFALLKEGIQALLQIAACVDLAIPWIAVVDAELATIEVLQNLRWRAVRVRRGPPGRGGSDDRIVGVSVDTMIVSTKSLMDTIGNVGEGTRGTSCDRHCSARSSALVG
jgi:hypothetical protein